MKKREWLTKKKCRENNFFRIPRAFYSMFLLLTQLAHLADHTHIHLHTGDSSASGPRFLPISDRLLREIERNENRVHFCGFPCRAHSIKIPSLSVVHLKFLFPPRLSKDACGWELGRTDRLNGCWFPLNSTIEDRFITSG
jgi:hypothetical protein